MRCKKCYGIMRNALSPITKETQTCGRCRGKNSKKIRQGGKYPEMIRRI